MNYHTGNIPHLSNGNFKGYLPFGIFPNFLDYNGMENREKEIKLILSEMKALGWNPRSLSMHLFGKPDRIRNYVDGKAKHWRSDTKDAVMEVLRNKIPNPATIKKPIINKKTSNATLEIMKGIAKTLAATGDTNKSLLQQFLINSVRDLRACDQLDEAEEISLLLQSLDSGASLPSTPAPHKRHEHPHQIYQKGKNSEN